MALLSAVPGESQPHGLGGTPNTVSQQEKFSRPPCRLRGITAYGANVGMQGSSIFGFHKT